MDGASLVGGKEFAWHYRRCKRHGFDPWVGKIPWSRKWQPAPVFLPEKSHGHKKLAGYSLWGHKMLELTEWLRIHTHSEYADLFLNGQHDRNPQIWVEIIFLEGQHLVFVLFLFPLFLPSNPLGLSWSCALWERKRPCLAPTSQRALLSCFLK